MMETVIITLALTGLVLLLLGTIYIIWQLATVHKLVNSRLSEALERIESLEKALKNSGVDVPPMPIRNAP